jgi:hypothetical protein
MPKAAKASPASELIVEGYRVISIDATSAPAGDAGNDWLVYRIGQGNNVVIGYRRGSRETVTAEVERIVDSFNERLLPRGRPYRSAGRPAKRAASEETAA